MRREPIHEHERDGLRVARTGRTVWASLCRVDRRNALDDDLIAALTELFARDWPAEGVGAVVLSAQGPCFCAGADLDWMRRGRSETEEQTRAGGRRLAGLFAAADGLDVPLVARVHGAVIGGAVGLAAVADVVLAEPSAFFQLSEVRLGLVPAVIAPYLVGRLGEAPTRAWMLGGHRMDARRALDLGLVTEIVEADDMQGAVDRWLDRFGRGAPGAQAAVKRLLRRLRRATAPDEVVERTVEVLTERRRSPEAAERIGAFFDRRRRA
jgi:methylglutaconyl-CoA hydratase